MSFKKALALVLTLLVIFMPFNYSFAVTEVKYNVTRNGEVGTVTSAVYCDNDVDARGVTVSFAVYDGLDPNGSIINKIAGITYNDFANGFYRYILDTFDFPIKGDNYQCRQVYVGPAQQPQPIPQFTGTVYLPNSTNPYTGGGSVEVYSMDKVVNIVPIQSDGTYSIGNIPDGQYYVVARPAEIEYCKSESSNLVITSGDANLSILDFTLVAAQFFGTIVAPDDSSAPSGNHVEVFDDSGNRLMDIMDNDKAQFAVSGLQDGFYTLRAITSPDSPYVASPKVTIEIKDLELVGNPPVLKLAERPVAQFSGTVYLPDGKTKFTGGGRVDVNAEYKYINNFNINEDGSYSVGGLTDGIYDLIATPNTTVYCKSLKVQIKIEGGALTSPTAPVNIALSTPQFTGTVVNPEGTTPFTNGTIEIMTGDKGNNNVQIQQDGSFAVGGLSDGTYNLQARPFDGAGNICKSNKIEITIAGGKLISPLGALKLTMLTPQFTGSVVDPKGNPVSNTNVEINDESGKYVDNVFVDKGIFRVAGLSDGYYKLRANAPQNSEYAASANVEIQILNKKISGSNPVLILINPQVTGTVVDPDGKPVSYGNVEIKGVDVNYGTGTMTDQNGVFRIAGLEDGIYSIKGSGFGTGFSPSKEINITITGGKYTAPDGGLVLKLTVPQLTGTVYLSDGSTPEKYSWIEVSDSFGKYITGTQSDETGKFNIGSLEDGTYQLRANPNWENNGYTASKYYEIVISDGTYSGGAISLTLCEPQISGTVKDPVGNTVSFGYIEVKNDAGEWLSGVSVQNGAFAIGSLKDGIYTIKAIPDSNSKYSSSNNFTFKIEIGELVNYGNYNGSPIVLTLQQAQITGSVLDPKGQPVKGGWVEVRSSDEKSGKYFGGTNIGYDGQFRIAGLADGDYMLVAWPNNGTSYTSSKEVKITIAGGKYAPPSGGLKLTLGIPQIIGEVVAPDGTPQGNGHVEVMTVDGMHVKGFGIDYTADFTIGGLKDGTYYLRAYPGYGSEYSASEEVMVKISGGVFSGGTLVLKLTSAQITGNVVNPNNTPVTNGWVNVNKTTGEYISGAQINDGKFKIGALKPGNYKMTAYPKDDSSFSESDAVAFTIDNTGKYTGSAVTLKLRSPQITGIVKGPLGSNTAYGFIEIKSVDKHLGGTGVDYKGEFKISGLAPGIYELIAMPGGDTTYSPSKEIQVIIDGGGKYTGEPLTMNLTTAQISGTVKDPGGNISKFGYCEVTAANGEWITGSQVNQNGKFAIGNLENGTYTLRVHPDYMLSSSYSASAPVTVVISGGICTTYGEGTKYGGNIDVTLTKVQLNGSVVDPKGDSVDMGWVEIQKNSGLDNWTWVGGTGVNPIGEFCIGGLSDGTYRMRAYPENWSSSYSPSSYAVFVVSGGKTTTVDGVAYGESLELKLLNAQITGTITGPKGETIEYGWIEITNLDGAFVTGIGAKEDGSFSIAGLSNGSYKIKAYPGWKSSFTPSQSQTITISGGVFSGGSLTLKLKTVQVTGKVVNPNGNAVDWGWIEVYNDNGQWVVSTGVDETGRFRLSGLANGSYKVQAFPANGSSYAASKKVSIVISGGIMTSTDSLELVLIDPKIKGVVHRPDNSLAKGGWIEIGDAGQKWLVTAPINKDGTFKIPELVPGDYTIQAFPMEGSLYAKSGVYDLKVDENGSYSPKVLDLQFTNK